MSKIIEMDYLLGIIGCGKIGKGLVKLFIKNGIVPVVLVRDKGKISQLQDEIRKYQERKLPGKKILSPVFTTNKRDLSCSSIIIEAIMDDFDEKVELYQSLKEFIEKDTIIGTTTSSLSINSLALESELNTQLVGLHFFNPPQIIPFLEIIPAKKFRSKLLQTLIKFIKSIRYEFVIIDDSPGFIANKILFAELLGAIELLVEKKIEKEVIDEVIKKSLKHPMGPFELLDLIGIDTADKIIHNLYDDDQRISYWEKYYNARKR